MFYYFDSFRQHTQFAQIYLKIVKQVNISCGSGIFLIKSEMMGYIHEDYSKNIMNELSTKVYRFLTCAFNRLGKLGYHWVCFL